MEEKKLALESKSCLALDLGRAYTDYRDIDYICVKTFPDEALNALQAFKNVMNANIFDPGEENRGFSNYIGWLEPVKETVKPSEQEVQSLIKTAETIRKKNKALVVIASGSTYLAARAGVDFFRPSFSAGSPKIVFLGRNASVASHEKAMSKLKAGDFSICVVEDGELSIEARAALSSAKALLKGKGKYYAFTNNEKSTFAQQAVKDGAELFKMSEGFTGPEMILSPALLLPLAAGGIDIKELIEGAELEPNEDMESFVPAGCGGAGATRELFIPLSSLNIKNYSVSRYLFKNKGYGLEMFVYTDRRLRGFVNWLKYLYMQNASSSQMFYVDAVDLSESSHIMDYAELHGKKFFETFLNIGNLSVSDNVEVNENSNMDMIGSALMTDVMRKQRKSGVPIMRIEIPSASPYYFGQMISLFTRTAAIMDIWKNE